MKNILDLKRAITNESYFSEQFKKNGTEKNILFVNPQLSENHLYKMILPFFQLRSEKIQTAITAISEFNTESQLLGEKEWEITDEMIDWATHIVFPFTTQPLVSEIYSRIRNRNSKVSIFYCVDFNFYLLPESHPFKYIFDEPTVVNDVEDNMYFSDAVIIGNYAFQHFLINIINGLTEGKYKGLQTPLKDVRVLTPIVDSEIVLGNVDFEVQDVISANPIHKPEVVELIEKTVVVAEVVKTEDIKQKGKQGKIKSVKKQRGTKKET